MQTRSTPLCILLSIGAACGSAHLDPNPVGREFRFELSSELPAQTTAPTTGERYSPRLATIWLPAPVADEYQELGALQPKVFGGEAIEMYDSKGNRILSVTGVPPLRLSYTVDVRRFRAVPPRQTFERGELPRVSPWLEPAARAPIDKVRKEALFKTAGRPDVTGKARLLYDGILNEMRYATPEGGGWGAGDLEWILRTKLGDSVDFHALFVAYCQSLAIPAYIEFGLLLTERPAAELTDVMGHNTWARFLVPGASWLPVDVAEARRRPEKRDFCFGGLAENRLRMTRGRDIVLNPRQSGPPLNFFVFPYAEYDGKDVSKQLTWRARFRDLSASR